MPCVSGAICVTPLRATVNRARPSSAYTRRSRRCRTTRRCPPPGTRLPNPRCAGWGSYRRRSHCCVDEVAADDPRASRPCPSNVWSAPGAYQFPTPVAPEPAQRRLIEFERHRFITANNLPGRPTLWNRLTCGRSSPANRAATRVAARPAPADFFYLPSRSPPFVCDVVITGKYLSSTDELLPLVRPRWRARPNFSISRHQIKPWRLEPISATSAFACRLPSCRLHAAMRYCRSSPRGRRAAPMSKVTKRERPRCVARATRRQSAKSADGNWSSR